MFESPVYGWILEEGIEKGKLEMARELKKRGLELDLIVSASGLSEELLREHGIE